MYLESLDGSQSYLADTFCNNHEKLENGKIYELRMLTPSVYCMEGEIGFYDWLKTTGKAPVKKLKAVWYGPNNA